MKILFLPCLLLACAILSLSACGGGSGLDSDADVAYVALGASDATGIGASPLSEGYVFEIEEGIYCSRFKLRH